MERCPDRYIFPAVFTRDQAGMWDARFPDLENCFTSTDTLEDAIEQAKHTLEDCLYFMEKDNAAIPAPSRVEPERDINSLTRLIVAYMPPIRSA